MEHKSKHDSVLMSIVDRYRPLFYLQAIEEVTGFDLSKAKEEAISKAHKEAGIALKK